MQWNQFNAFDKRLQSKIKTRQQYLLAPL